MSALTKREREAMTRRIRGAAKRLAQVRDDLRSVVMEAQGYMESAEEAEDALTEAVEILSRYV